MAKEYEHKKHEGHHHVHPEHPSHHSHNAEDPGIKRDKTDAKGISYHAGAEKVASGMHHASKGHMGAGNGYLKGDK